MLTRFHWRDKVKMEPNAVCAFVLVLTVIVVGVYDVYATYALGPEGTVTYVVRKWSIAFPVLPLAIGILLGHLFWASASNGALPDPHSVLQAPNGSTKEHK